MAWGYEASFIIEHDETLKRKISCKDCVYYDSSDKSCNITPRYLPEDGYDSWRWCGKFKLSESAHNYKIKEKQAKRLKSGGSKKESKKQKNVMLGTNVMHVKYGKGKIVGYQKGIVEVKFGNGEIRSFNLQFCKQKGILV